MQHIQALLSLRFRMLLYTCSLIVHTLLSLKRIRCYVFVHFHATCAQWYLKRSFEYGGRGLSVSTVSFVTPLQGQESYSIHFVFVSGIGLRLFIFPFFCQGACSLSQAAFVRVKTCTP
jgi:hypothetical protein